MITERTLKRWRREALHITRGGTSPTTSPDSHNINSLAELEYNKRILRLTQELLDVHLLRKV